MGWLSDWVKGMLVLLLVTGCSESPSDKRDILVEVNAYRLTASEFQHLFAEDAKNDPEMTITDQAKRNYLNEIIQKEVLIQEAKRLKFDQKPKFIHTIERYWEATLIRDLMESRGRDIEERTVVTQEEKQHAYDALKQNNPGIPPLAEIETKLVAKITDEKKTAMFQKWIEELKQQASIRVNEKLMDDM